MMRTLMIFLIIYLLDLLSARPAEEPTKFTLSNVQNAENVTSSKLEETKQINNEFRNPDLLIIKSNKPQNHGFIIPSVPPLRSTTPIVLFPPMSRETVRLENETAQAILEKRKPDNIRQILNSILTPKPLVDRIKNEEKYGNMVDNFIGRAIINSYENFSNFVNFLLGFPVGIAKQVSRGVTQTLDELGARIIGLQ